MNTKRGWLMALALGVVLTVCASTGTQVSSNSDGYKDLAKSQQAWCSTFGNTCTCSIDGMKTTCSLVYACLNSGNCKATA
jgi:hypothetical protein